MSQRLGIGFIGSGFITKFHIRAFQAVRDADVLGVFSPNQDNAAETANLARELNVGQAKACSSISEMVADPNINALWLCGPNNKRVENVSEVVETIRSGKGQLKGLACEKPLARNAKEAREIVELVNSVDLSTGYLENQVFSPGLIRARDILWQRGASLTGRPYLARAAEEHSGPHTPWFWQGELQGGGVLNDMMCHSVEVVRFLLTEPGKPRSSVKPVRIRANISCLKWARPNYAAELSNRMGSEVDYSKNPVEDYASATIDLIDDQGYPLIGEVTNSWSYVGPGLRLSFELLGPEYSMSMNTLDSGPKLFLSRAVKGDVGEDLVEKQNAETGVMPVLSNEPGEYGYEEENRHMVQCFLTGETPRLTFADGLEVVELLMSAYKSAEEQRTLSVNSADIATFVPQVAQGSWSAEFSENRI